MQTLMRVQLSMVVLMIVSCGKSESATGVTDATVPTDTSVADMASSIDVSTDASAPIETTANPANLRVSYVSADSFNAGGAANWSVGAGFYDEIPNTSTSTVETIGPCRVEIVTFGSSNFDIKYSSAGNISIDGGLVGVGMKPNVQGMYTPLQGDNQALWKGGEALTFTAKGGTVPKFSTTVTAPTQLAITAPPYPFGTAIPLPRTTDFKLTWDGTTAGSVVVQLVGKQVTDKPQTYLTCTFAGTDSQGTIPAAALAKIALTGIGTLSIISSSESIVMAGSWGEVKVGAISRATTKSGVPFNVTVDVK